LTVIKVPKIYAAISAEPDIARAGTTAERYALATARIILRRSEDLMPRKTKLMSQIYQKARGGLSMDSPADKGYLTDHKG